jgi:hypothetical protein
MQSSRARLSGFFERFQVNCSVIYERVECEVPQVCRRLAPMLEARDFAKAETPLRSEYQFSFKKTETTCSIARNHSDYPFPPSQQDNGTRYYLQNANRPKIKLRKFHSLISIKKDSSSVQPLPSPSPSPMVRRNHSMVKK